MKNEGILALVSVGAQSSSDYLRIAVGVSQGNRPGCNADARRFRNSDSARR